MTDNTRLTKLKAARAAGNDEFYTQLPDIEAELKYYREHFRGKTVLLNCDDPEESNFWRYFSEQFEALGLKRLISTHYTGLGSSNPPPSYVLEIVSGRDLNNDGRVDNLDTVKTLLKGDGDFRSAECVELLKQADVVVTNPPFSIFREYMAQLMEFNKDFIIMGNVNAITYKEVWPLIQEGKIWLGVTSNGGERWFKVPDHYTHSKNVKRGPNGEKLIGVGTRWFTNLEHQRRREELPLFAEYSPEKYPKYDNFDAIEVSQVKNIPADYDGYMGVPITFLGKHNPDQFEIVSGWNGGKNVPNPGASMTEYEDKNGNTKSWNGPTLGRKTKYYRIIIRRQN